MVSLYHDARGDMEMTGSYPANKTQNHEKKSKYRGSNGLLLLGILWSCHGPFHNLYHPGVGGMHLRLEV